ncbi:hypothetical protein KPL71_024264 [Citrus sinensis]|uniref:Uncharacterized protein n=1 Tax=Citrus sinensis TaxID=2711 RepID=A0ACB8IQS0_CITSI|nr:hypothetical protein KPL71_024264 [Citrus sinensis]
MAGLSLGSDLAAIITLLREYQLRFVVYVIVVVGGPPYAETQGESLNLTISEPGPSTTTNVCAAVKCVVLLVSGRPLKLGLIFRKWMLPLLLGLLGLKARELLMCISETMDLQGSCRARTWFKTVDQLPRNFGYEQYAFSLRIWSHCWA